MKLEDILNLWELDSVISSTDLGNESIKIPKLHNKYYKIYITERLLLRKYQEELKQLKLEKQEFYLMGPTEETHAKGWKLPPQGKVLKQDLSTYIEADKEVIQLNLKMGVQHEKIDFLESIIKSLTNRGYQIKNAIDWERFRVGAF